MKSKYTAVAMEHVVCSYPSLAHSLFCLYHEYWMFIQTLKRHWGMTSQCISVLKNIHLMTKKIFVTLRAADLGLPTHLSFVHLKEWMALAVWLKANKPWWYQVKESWKFRAACVKLPSSCLVNLNSDWVNSYIHTSTDCTELSFPNGDAFPSGKE